MDFENPCPERSAELYVWKNKALTGNDNTYYTVLSEQTNEINKSRTASEIYDLAKASDDLNDINLQLSGIPNLTYLAVYQMNTADFSKQPSKIQRFSPVLPFKFHNRHQYMQSICLP
ncbi:hypothetical protein LPY66_16910 [Dehalobacter sp. DCM]|uniref:hypothetical protein n=1 Tax=Dehalobacter sp. DCM TaxID=2907827 RepID=UPI003081F4A2|nr:hypothetical protein LPY66_16910 [Dehalobacter sp. DCM]